MVKKAAEKIKPLFSFRKNRQERLDEALSAVLEALTSSKQILAKQKKGSDDEDIDFTDIPMLWNKAAVNSRYCDREVSVQCLSLAENFSEAVGWGESEVEQTTQSLDAVFKMVKEILEKKRP